MPVERLIPEGAPTAHRRGPRSPDGAIYAAVLRPYRSMGPRGFARVIVFAYALFLLPLLGMLGTAALWVTLPFVLLALGALWFFIRANAADGALYERLTVWPGAIEVIRREPRRTERGWRADPYWVRLFLHPAGGPVRNYVTLRGGGREIELGAFLSPEERAALHADLKGLLERLRRPS